ncbi:MAG: SDR family oxidoreductase [Ruminococcaceae bacterium]|nr:SDR family oxidoreductase [Oscillospiraceae bacterium]
MKGVALVTGASRGIGRATALQLAKDGFAVAVHCLHSIDEAEAVCHQIRANGKQAQTYLCDVADTAAVHRMVQDIQLALGPITALVNNAGIAQQKLFTDITPEEWHRMMAVHVDGIYNTCHAVLPEMIRNHAGTIVNVSSMWGQTGGSCEVHYSTAKAAVIGFTKALAKEVGPAGIRVNCVAPGVIKTDMMAGFDEETLSALAEETPLCRLGTPEDVANAVSFLVSEQAGFITGQVLAPNGGTVI